MYISMMDNKEKFMEKMNDSIFYDSFKRNVNNLIVSNSEKTSKVSKLELILYKIVRNQFKDSPEDIIMLGHDGCVKKLMGE